MRSPSGPAEGLWQVTFGPAIWTVHFILCYVTTAVWCAKVAGRDGTIEALRVTVGLYTAAALFGIALAGWRGLVMHRLGEASVPHDFDTPEDRHRFLGFATLLLCALSGVATLFVGGVALFFASCR